jgi:hypothetical protein
MCFVCVCVCVLGVCACCWCVYVGMYECVCMYVCICIYVCMYVCIYNIYIYIYICRAYSLYCVFTCQTCACFSRHKRSVRNKTWVTHQNTFFVAKKKNRINLFQVCMLIACMYMLAYECDTRCCMLIKGIIIIRFVGPLIMSVCANMIYLFAHVCIFCRGSFIAHASALDYPS